MEYKITLILTPEEAATLVYTLSNNLLDELRKKAGSEHGARIISAMVDKLPAFGPPEHATPANR